MNRDQLEGRVREDQAEDGVNEPAGAEQNTSADGTNAANRTAADVRREWREARKQHRAPRPARAGKR